MKRISFIFGLYAFFLPLHAFAQDSDTPLSQYNFLQSIPGLVNQGESITSIGPYITGLFNFGIVLIGISALVMITIGGFWYVTSAGNQTRATNAKSIITDSFLGLFVALFAFLILRTINPDLVEGGLSRLQGGALVIDGGGNNGGDNGGGTTVQQQCRVGTDECFDSLDECTGPRDNRQCELRDVVVPSPTSDSGPTDFGDSAFAEMSSADFRYCNATGSVCYDSIEECFQATSSTNSCTLTANNPGALTDEQRSRLASHNQNMQNLQAGGVAVKGNFPATSLAGLPSTAVNETIALQRTCDCELVVTGGTEAGHQTHGIGQNVVDFRVTPSLTSYIGESGVPTELSNGNTSYTFESGPLSGATVVLEGAGTPNQHYHVSWE